MKVALQIILTNWINIVLLVFTTFIYAFITSSLDKEIGYPESFYSATYLTFFYGIIFWLGFIISIVILDVLLFAVNKRKQNASVKLLIEWLIISIPLLYLLIKHNQWILFVAIITLLVAQFIRKARILRILSI